MLHIFYGEYNGDNYISAPAIYFDHQCEDDWVMVENTGKIFNNYR